MVHSVFLFSLVVPVFSSFSFLFPLVLILRSASTALLVCPLLVILEKCATLVLLELS